MQIFQKSKEFGNFTKEYEITRRETQRFYYETWKDMKSFAQKHTQLRSGEFRTKMKEQYVENMARLIRLVQIIRFNSIKGAKTQIRQFTIYYAGLLGRWSKPIVGQASDFFLSFLRLGHSFFFVC